MQTITVIYQNNERVIYHDEENEEEMYSISLIEKGGPIISASSLEEAKTKFDSALKISNAIKKFLYFQKHKIFE